MAEFLSRQPFSLLGAMSILSIVANIVELSDDIVKFVDAWRQIVRPIADFLFGWVAALFSYELPNLAKDYLVIGLVSFGASMRQSFSSYDDVLEAMPMALTSIILWPLVSVFVIFQMFDDPDDGYVYLETYIYALMLLGTAFFYTQLS